MSCKLMDRLHGLEGFKDLPKESKASIEAIICGTHNGVCMERYSGQEEHYDKTQRAKIDSEFRFKNGEGAKALVAQLELRQLSYITNNDGSVDSMQPWDNGYVQCIEDLKRVFNGEKLTQPKGGKRRLTYRR